MYFLVHKLTVVKLHRAVNPRMGDHLGILVA